MKVLSQNKKALHDYHVIDRIEAGLVLTGDEVKSIKAGHASLIGAFATIHNGELFLLNANISTYDKAYSKSDDPRKSRKLLLHRREIGRLVGDIARKGITVIPLALYMTKRGLIKVELGICQAKKNIDKKQELKEKDIKRETQRELKKYS